MTRRPSRAIIADGFRVIDGRLEFLVHEVRRVLRKAEAMEQAAAERAIQQEQRFDQLDAQLEQIRRLIVEGSERQSEHRDHVRDQFDRLGTRVLALEKQPNGGE